MRKLLLLLLLIPACSAPVHLVGQTAQAPDKTIDAATRQQVIEGAIRALNESYVFPETARKMEAMLRERMQRKEYDNVTSASAFASLLTTQLQEVSHDKHLRVFLAGTDARVSGTAPDATARERYREMAAKRNFGFERVERLSGNIGYLDLRGFEIPDWPVILRRWQ